MDGVGIGEEQPLAASRRLLRQPWRCSFRSSPEGGGPASTTRTDGNDWAISRVRSVEASSTTMISKPTPVCAASDSRQAPRQASSLRAGTMTDTVGLLDTVSGATIGRIRYYNFVRRASVLPGTSGSSSGADGLLRRIAARPISARAAPDFHGPGQRPQGQPRRVSRQGGGAEFLGHLVSALH